MSTPREQAEALRAAQRAKLRSPIQEAGLSIQEAAAAQEHVEEHGEPTAEAVEVKSVCRRCYGHGVSRAEVTPEVLAPNGRAHKAGRAGRTDCGVAITGDWTIV